MPVTPCRTDMVRSYARRWQPGSIRRWPARRPLPGSAQEHLFSRDSDAACHVEHRQKIQSDQLHQALERHGEETETQVERLEQVFEMLNKPAGGKACKAIEETVSEVYQVIEKFKDGDALDAPHLSAVRAVENYEISCYEKLKTWAEELGMEDAVKLLDETLQEEKKTVRSSGRLRRKK